ncbi:2-amino-4-hydroxy-6-hydroxymethyldihydropteridine diphosphokinase [Saccharobesus litoralis]|uniref:2-amino-4-hydroxy-6-hydroxymethyldihydropteridine diphosphokinase n=1 Tax=Saccharobesus litoralis TaxID=2172099 RepID=A0A2S0VRM9_9ALTE|nr:2-amino-4-hydroxy-6-hydroxymethyldihydropteridine diphosphokinase [Saccharobesus litoralis]AWB66881.1 2-amino-4-hydroxy-6-hydroxymethyldihydropteridine diphosphokinase [Saccharobesus litoralis]
MALIFISIGSNVEREQHILNGVNALKLAFENVVLSPVFESEAVGFNGDPFLNLAASAQTDKSIAEVVALLKQIEDSNGRVRKCEKFSSRTLDLDLLTYDQLVVSEPVVLPRDEITKNAFVLWPLAELAPTEIHPTVLKTYQQMWNEYDKTQQKLHIVPFNF